MSAALSQLIQLDQKTQLLARDVAVIDLRLPDRVTVRLPEGRTLDEIIAPEDSASAAERSRT
jgi:cell division protein FtsQ